jgi:hypothetical protein
MISTSKLGGFAFVAAIGLASPAFAQMPAGAIGKGSLADPSSPQAFSLVACYSAACNGGGSTGYNHSVATDYRLKKHPQAHHTAKVNHATPQ